MAEAFVASLRCSAPPPGGRAAANAERRIRQSGCASSAPSSPVLATELRSIARNGGVPRLSSPERSSHHRERSARRLDCWEAELRSGSSKGSSCLLPVRDPGHEATSADSPSRTVRRASSQPSLFFSISGGVASGNQRERIESFDSPVRPLSSSVTVPVHRSSVTGKQMRRSASAFGRSSGSTGCPSGRSASRRSGSYSPETFHQIASHRLSSEARMLSRGRCASQERGESSAAAVAAESEDSPRCRRRVVAAPASLPHSGSSGTCQGTSAEVSPQRMGCGPAARGRDNRGPSPEASQALDAPRQGSRPSSPRRKATAAPASVSPPASPGRASHTATIAPQSVLEHISYGPPPSQQRARAPRISAAAPRSGSPAGRDAYKLRRFTQAQKLSFAQALSEIRSGRKLTAWMWFVIPTPPYIMKGVERGSADNRRYALRSDEEVSAYLYFQADGVDLKCNYFEIMEAIRDQLRAGRHPMSLMGKLSAPKLYSSVQLFARVTRGSADLELHVLLEDIMELLDMSHK